MILHTLTFITHFPHLTTMSKIKQNTVQQQKCREKKGTRYLRQTIHERSTWDILVHCILPLQWVLPYFGKHHRVAGVFFLFVCVGLDAFSVIRISGFGMCKFLHVDIVRVVFVVVVCVCMCVSLNVTKTIYKQPWYFCIRIQSNRKSANGRTTPLSASAPEHTKIIEEKMRNRRAKQMERERR